MSDWLADIAQGLWRPLACACASRLTPREADEWAVARREDRADLTEPAPPGTSCVPVRARIRVYWGLRGLYIGVSAASCGKKILGSDPGSPILNTIGLTIVLLFVLMWRNCAIP